MNSQTKITHWNGVPLKSMNSHELIEVIQELWRSSNKWEEEAIRNRQYLTIPLF